MNWYEERWKWCSEHRIRVLQNPVEFKQALEVVKDKITINKALEVGSARGGSLYILAGICAPKARIVGVDEGLRKNSGGLNAVKDQLIKDGFDTSIIFGNSGDVETSTQVGSALPDGEQFDFLHIDASHVYKSVKIDFDTYKTFVRSGGWIMFHDIKFQGVPKLWDEIKLNAAETVIISTGLNVRTCATGIGLWQKP